MKKGFWNHDKIQRFHQNVRWGFGCDEKKGSLLFKFQKSHFYLYNVLNEGVWVRAPALKLFISIIISCSFDGTRLSRFYHFCFYAFKVFVSEFKRIFSTWDILNGKINVEVVYLWWLWCLFFAASSFYLRLHFAFTLTQRTRAHNSYLFRFVVSFSSIHSMTHENSAEHS